MTSTVPYREGAGMPPEQVGMLRCPNCGSGVANVTSRHLDEDRSWVGGYVQYHCGVQWWNEGPHPFFTDQTTACIRLERDRLRNALSSQTQRLEAAMQELAQLSVSRQVTP